MGDLLGCDFVDPNVISIPQRIIEDFAPVVEEYRVMPLGIQDGVLVVAAEDPLDLSLLDALKFICNQEVRLVGSSPSALSLAIQQHYGVHPSREQ
jgi:predicted ATP-grasp superfamily ATP-dependent carboligase